MNVKTIALAGILTLIVACGGGVQVDAVQWTAVNRAVVQIEEGERVTVICVEDGRHKKREDIHKRRNVAPPQSVEVSMPSSRRSDCAVVRSSGVNEAEHEAAIDNARDELLR